jgi:hypothetical protein
MWQWRESQPDLKYYPRICLARLTKTLRTFNEYLWPPPKFAEFSSVCWVTWREWRRIGWPKRCSLENWKGRDEEEDPGKDGEKKWKEIFKCWE